MSILKKLIVVVAIIICFLNILTAQGISSSLTLAEIVTQSHQGDIKALLANKEIDKLTKNIKDVNEKAEETNVLAGTAQTQLNSKVIKYIEPLRAALNLELAQRNERQRLIKREADIEYAYWQVYLAQMALERAQIELKIANNNYKAAKIKHKNGSISGNKLAAERYTYEQKQLNTIECSNNHIKTLYNLNQLLEQNLTTTFAVNDTVALNYNSFSYNIDEVYKDALEQNEENFRLSKEAVFAKMKLLYAEEEFKQTSDEYLDVVMEKERADYDYYSSKNNLYRSIKSDSDYLIIGLENYELLNLKLDLEQSNMKATEIKLGKGHASTNDYLQAKANVLSSRHQLYSLITELNYKYQIFHINYIFKN